MPLIRRCAGTNGVLELFSDHLKIIRPGGCFTPFNRGEKMIPYSKLTGVQFKPRTITAGFIQFVFSGSQESKGKIWEAVHDENTVLFTNKELADFEFARDFVRERILNPTSPNMGQNAATTQPTEQLAYLERLASLRDQGIVTQEEFEAKKRLYRGA
jgi:Short C-terminal domain/Domain of unknown function (DUF4429)